MVGGGARPEPAVGARGSTWELWRSAGSPAPLQARGARTSDAGVGAGQAVWVLLGSPGGPVLHSSMTFVVDFINFLDRCGL